MHGYTPGFEDGMTRRHHNSPTGTSHLKIQVMSGIPTDHAEGEVKKVYIKHFDSPENEKEKEKEKHEGNVTVANEIKSVKRPGSTSPLRFSTLPSKSTSTSTLPSLPSSPTPRPRLPTSTSYSPSRDAVVAESSTRHDRCHVEDGRTPFTPATTTMAHIVSVPSASSFSRTVSVAPVTDTTRTKCVRPTTSSWPPILRRRARSLAIDCGQPMSLSDISPVAVEDPVHHDKTHNKTGRKADRPSPVDYFKYAMLPLYLVGILIGCDVLLGIIF